MANERYELEDIDLMTIPHKGKDIVVARFGPDWYSQNVKAMGEHYWNSDDFPNVTFRPATTAESISAIAYGFKEIAKPDISHLRWIQAGSIVRTNEGVYVNPLKAIKNCGEIDERTLKALRDKSKLVNGIWLGDNDFAFAPYGSFEQGIQESEKFAEGGLARALEHVDGNVAPNLLAMASTDFGKKPVNIIYFDKSEEPIVKLVDLYSDDECFLVYGYYLDGNYDGHAFGVLSSDAQSAEATPKN